MLGDLLHGFKGLIKADQPEWDFQDRRRLVRLKCQYNVKAEVEKTKFNCTVLDIGVLGLKLTCTHALQPGQIVRLTIPSPREGATRLPIDGRVVWAKVAGKNFLTQAGLVYASDANVMKCSWVNYILYEMGFKPDSIYSKRRFVRADCVLTGQVAEAGKPPVEVKICNLGVGGALLGGRSEFAPGTQLTLHIGPQAPLPILCVSGQAVRVQSDRHGKLCGIEFDELSVADTKLLGKYLHALLAAEK